MKFVKFIFLLLLFTSLACVNVKDNEQAVSVLSSEIVDAKIENLLSNNKLNGVIIIYDVQKEAYYSNDFQTAKTKRLPASTFKIPNSIIGLETGILADANSIFKWDGSSRSFPMWEKDLTLKEAFQVSCVPCYQGLAMSIGLDTMQAYLDKLAYPGMDVNLENLNMFWLQGESKISPIQQIEFLIRLYKSELDISAKTTEVIKEILQVEKTTNYILSGKTGWGIIGDENLGWFVGYLEKEKENYFFATCIEPQSDFDMDGFIQIRKSITLDAFKELKIL